jgi:prefoldin beta subunit
MQNQLRTIRIQIDTSQRQTTESKQTLKEIQSLDESTEIYKISGGILFNSSLEKVKSDLEDSVEYLDIQLQKLNKREKELGTVMKNLEQELTTTLK